MSTPAEAAASLNAALRDASIGLVDRESLVELVALAAVAGEHVLVVGPPGTAKSEAVRRVADALGGKVFEYLVGRFTEPSELFGPIDLRRLREGIVETVTTGMLPEAEIAFLDEIFLGSTAILNTLLGLLNDRSFRRGATTMRSPLRVCVGASNGLPDDTALAAFADRFLVRVFVEPTADSRLEELLEAGWSLGQPRERARATIGDLETLSVAARSTDLTAARRPLAHALRLLRRSGIALSDRRSVKVQRLIAAAAVMAGRARPTEADLWPIVAAIPTRDEQEAAREVLRELLSATENASLPAAAEAASRGPAARAQRIVASGEAAFATAPSDDPEARETWRLKLEGIAREIDATFAPASTPDAVTKLRARIVSALATA